jgi:hypothetical protein
MFNNRQSEFDKISHEILNQIYPMEALQNYYCFGVAEILKELSKTINGFKRNITKEEFNMIIEHIVNQHEKVKEYYERLNTK